MDLNMAIQHFKCAKRLATSGTNYEDWKETGKVNADNNVICALYIEFKLTPCRFERSLARRARRILMLMT